MPSYHDKILGNTTTFCNMPPSIVVFINNSSLRLYIQEVISNAARFKNEMTISI